MNTLGRICEDDEDHKGQQGTAGWSEEGINMWFGEKLGQ
jgi:hypothetical protein